MFIEKIRPNYKHKAYNYRVAFGKITRALGVIADLHLTPLTRPLLPVL